MKIPRPVLPKALRRGGQRPLRYRDFTERTGLTSRERCEEKLDRQYGGHRCNQARGHQGRHTAFGHQFWGGNPVDVKAR